MKDQSIGIGETLALIAAELLATGVFIAVVLLIPAHISNLKVVFPV